MTQLSITINDRKITQDVTPRMHLGDFIREQARLTGTHLGCEHGVCGACVVLVDGKPVRSCITYAVSCDGQSVTTIEGFEIDPVMAMLRIAFSAHHALQCGFCTPGMLTTSRDIVLRLPQATERTVRAELSGNLCRCTGYVGIVEAVMSVLQALRDHPEPQIEAMRADITTGKIPMDVSDAQVRASFQTYDTTPSTPGNSAPPSPHRTTSAVAGAPGSAPTLSQGTRLKESVDVPFAPADVWRLMVDLPAVALCLPGAKITGVENDLLQGSVSVKFGPMRASFEGEATLVANAESMSAVLKGSGRDKLSNSRATGDVSYRIEALAANASRVHIELTYALQGPLAQFSRSGLVQDFVRRLIRDFADNLTHSLQHPGTATEMPRQSIHAVSLFFTLLWNRLRRLFGARP